MSPVVDDDLGDTCAWCGKKDRDLLACSRCKVVIYCGWQCQRAHWPGHKVECPRLEREHSAPTRAPRSSGSGAVAASSTPEGRNKMAAEEEKELYRQHLDRMNQERAREARRAAAERHRKKREEAFLHFMAGLRRHLLPRLPPCGPRDKVPVIVCGPAKAITRRVEPAGIAFHEMYERSSPNFCRPEEAHVPQKRQQSQGRKREESRGRSRQSSRGPRREASSAVARSSRSFNFPEARSKYNMHKARPDPQLEDVELFTLLGLEMKPGYSPSQEDIKEAYRKQIMVIHPDKAGSQGTEGIVLLQSAYEFLTDVDNKQIYESSLPFDDAVPSEEQIQEHGFFRTLRPVFKRNSKWSVETPVPDLGNANTPLEEVREFYRFWFDFTSWRDVPPRVLKTYETELYDIYDCPRQERREKQKHNTSVRRKFEVQEGLRITKLVCLAWKLDPRLEEVRRKGRKKEEEQAEEEVAEEQEQEVQMTEEERRRQEAALEEERRLEREAREELRKVTRKRRARLLKVVMELHLKVDRAELHRLCLTIAPEPLEALAVEVERLGAQAMHSEGSADGGEDLEDSPHRHQRSREETLGRALKAGSGRAKRKTSKQLAQEAIFEAMRKAGMEPTIMQLSPKEAEAMERREAEAKEQAERARRERAKKRREEEKEERRRKKEEDFREEQRMMKARELEAREKNIKTEINRTLQQLHRTSAAIPNREDEEEDDEQSQDRDMDFSSEDGLQQTEDNGQTYYDILDVPRNAKMDQIEDAYKRLSGRYYDMKDNLSQQENRKLAEAYQVLSDPLKRELYDLFGEDYVTRTFDLALMPEDNGQTYYDILDLPPNAKMDQIEEAYRRLSRRFYDMKDKLSQQENRKVAEAYQVLSDPLEKELYDLFGADYITGTVDPDLIPEDLESTLALALGLAASSAESPLASADRSVDDRQSQLASALQHLSANFGKKRGARREHSARADSVSTKTMQAENDDRGHVESGHARVVGGNASILAQRAAVLERLEEYLETMKRFASIADQTWERRTWREELQCWSGVEDAWNVLRNLEKRGVEIDSFRTSQVLMQMVTRAAKEDTELMDFMKAQRLLPDELPRVASSSQGTPLVKTYVDPMEHLELQTDVAPHLLDWLESLAQHEREEILRERRAKKALKRGGKAHRRRQRQPDESLDPSEVLTRHLHREEVHMPATKADQERRQQERQRAEQERQQRAEELAIRNATAERELQAFERNGDPATVEKVQRLTEFMRIGGTTEAAGEVARAAINAAPELSELLSRMEAYRCTDPEGYADDVLSLLAECTLPFFELGIRPPESAPRLPPMVRTKVKHARQTLRNLVKKDFLVYEEAPEPAPVAAAASNPGKARGARSRSRARSASAAPRRSSSRRQR